MATEIVAEVDVPFHVEIVAILKVYAVTVLAVGGLLTLFLAL